MLRILPFACLLFLFSSCTTYQYMTVSSNNIQQDDQRDFVVENDTLRLRYSFYGANAPVNIEVQNRLGKPIYVDWKRSALIINERAISYKPGSLTVSGSTYTSVDNWFSGVNRGLSSASGSSSFSSTVEFPGDMEFIPPTARINQTPLSITNVFYESKSGGEFTRERVKLTDDMTGTIQRATYDEGNSPLKFSSYLTVFVDGDINKPVVFHHNFYVSEIIASNLNPQNFRFINAQEGNRFYISKMSGAGQGIGYGILAGLVVVGVVAGANAADNVPNQ